MQCSAVQFPVVTALSKAVRLAYFTGEAFVCSALQCIQDWLLPLPLPLPLSLLLPMSLSFAFSGQFGERTEEREHHNRFKGVAGRRSGPVILVIVLLHVFFQDVFRMILVVTIITLTSWCLKFTCIFSGGEMSDS